MTRRLRACLCSRRGAALPLVLCLGAALLALAAVLLAAAGQLGASAARLLPQEQAYQLARTFSERLDADLCAGTPTGIAEFLTTRFLQSPYADDTAYTFTAEPGDAADPYGQLSVTLQRRRLARGAQAAWDLGAGLSAGELAAQMDAFEHTAAELADYEITVTVNAAVSGAAFSYTQRYERRVVCRVAYTVAGQVYGRRAGTLEFYPLSDPQMQGPPALTAQTLPDRGQVEANGEPSAAAADSRYVNLEKGGS